jgi:hypothetical protein
LKKVKTSWAGRLAWLGHLLDVQKVAGPNPVRPTKKQFLFSEARIVRKIFQEQDKDMCTGSILWGAVHFLFCVSLAIRFF